MIGQRDLNRQKIQVPTTESRNLARGSEIDRANGTTISVLSLSTFKVSKRTYRGALDTGELTIRRARTLYNKF
jgi:hypothetical protein